MLFALCSINGEETRWLVLWETRKWKHMLTRFTLCYQHSQPSWQLAPFSEKDRHRDAFLLPLPLSSGLPPVKGPLLSQWSTAHPHLGAVFLLGYLLTRKDFTSLHSVSPSLGRFCSSLFCLVSLISNLSCPLCSTCITSAQTVLNSANNDKIGILLSKEKGLLWLPGPPF